jgi:hypothetical protein
LRRHTTPRCWIDQVEAEIGELEGQIAAQTPPSPRRRTASMSPGVGRVAAHVIIAEIDLDMTRFAPRPPGVLGPVRARHQGVRLERITFSNEKTRYIVGWPPTSGGSGSRPPMRSAKAVGISHDSPERIKAGLQFTLSVATGDRPLLPTRNRTDPRRRQDLAG